MPDKWSDAQAQVGFKAALPTLAKALRERDETRAEVDRLRPVVEAARAFVEHQQRGQPGTPGTLYPFTYAALDQWHDEWDVCLERLVDEMAHYNATSAPTTEAAND